MKKILIRFSCATVAAVVVAVGVQMSSANAATNLNRCNPGYFCIFTGLEGTGSMSQFQNRADLGAWKGGLYNNNVKSVWNRSPYTVIAWDHTNKTGAQAIFSECDIARNLVGVPVGYTVINTKQPASQFLSFVEVLHSTYRSHPELNCY